MTITKPGEIPLPPQPWWVGLKLRCSNCSTEFVLDEFDAASVTVTQARMIWSQPVANVDCPFCGTKCSKSKE